MNNSIVILDDCRFFLDSAGKLLKKRGHQNVTLCDSSRRSNDRLSDGEPDLLFVDIHLGEPNDGLDYVQNLRTSGYRGFIAMCSVDFSLDAIDRSVWAGANDFFIKNNNLDFVEEVEALLERCHQPGEKMGLVKNLVITTFLRCIDLTQFEYKLLEAFFPDLPQQKELSFILNRSEGFIRKSFSNIYRKFQVNGPAQLARMLTLCSRFSVTV
jgi:DNA-binding NarL/FixJ family response regulator